MTGKSTTTMDFNPPCLDNIEDIFDYQPDGLHPTNIGDVLVDRYKILHKLGYGGLSTVWLAHDAQCARYVALKIIRAEHSKNRTELAILERLEKGSSEHPGRSHIQLLNRSFEFEGPNGQHLCLVYEVLGPSIASIRSIVPTHNCALNADAARKIARHAVEALDFIHSQGICHGDITPSNLLLKVDSIDTWSTEEIYQRFGPPVEDEVTDPWMNPIPGDSHPPFLIAPAIPPPPQYLITDAVLVNYGQSSLEQPLEKEDIGIPFCYYAPESMLDGKASVYSDIWALGCLIYEIRSGRQLFQDWSGSEDEAIMQMVETLGKMPEPWWQLWEGRHGRFEDDGTPIPGKASTRSLERSIAEIGRKPRPDGYQDCTNFWETPEFGLSEEEAALFKDLLQGMLKWNPEERSSLSSVLKHPWFSL